MRTVERYFFVITTLLYGAMCSPDHPFWQSTRHALATSQFTLAAARFVLVEARDDVHEQ